MPAYSDAELERILASHESDRAELKESFKGNAPTTVREAVCAFANDLPNHRRAGVVFIGVRDDGSPSGLAVTDELLRALADIKSDGNIVPPPTLFVERRRLRGADVAVVTVEPADSPPVRYAGRIHVRVGPRRGLATEQDERVLNEKRRHRHASFDVQPVHAAQVSDLGRRRFEEEYLPGAFAPDVLEANERTFEQRLAATKMIVSAGEPTPTVLGLLVLGQRPRDFLPGAYVQFLRIAGRTLADPIVDEQAIDGAVADVLRRAHDKLLAHIRTEVDITQGLTERRRSTYPIAALDQLLGNAVMHRSYEATNAPVRVTWYEDRIEILSPGGPFGSVTEQNFGRPGVTDYRNPNLAEALRVLGFVQKFGVGISTARRALEEGGHPALEFQLDASHVGVTVRARPSA